MASRKIARNPCRIPKKIDESDEKSENLNNGVSVLHPLLIYNVLNVLFQHLPKNELLTCRGVCHMWEETSRNVLKKCKLTPIRFSPENEGQTVEKFEEMFKTSVSTCNSSLFQSFNITDIKTLKKVGNLLSKYDEDVLNIRDFSLKLSPYDRCIDLFTSLTKLNYTLKFLTAISSSVDSLEIEEFARRLTSKKVAMEFPNLTKLSLHFKGPYVSFSRSPSGNTDNYFYHQILGSMPKLSKLEITIKHNYCDHFNFGLYFGLNLSSMKSTLKELNLNIVVDRSGTAQNLEDTTNSIFEQQQDLKLKIFTFNLRCNVSNVSYNPIRLFNFINIMRKFERFLQSQADTLVDLKIDVKISNFDGTYDGEKIKLMSNLPKVKKLGYFVQLDKVLIVSTNLAQTCPELTHLEIGQNCIETITPMSDDFKSQLTSYKIA